MKTEGGRQVANDRLINGSNAVLGTLIMIIMVLTPSSLIHGPEVPVLLVWTSDLPCDGP